MKAASTLRLVVSRPHPRRSPGEKEVVHFTVFPSITLTSILSRGIASVMIFVISSIASCPSFFRLSIISWVEVTGICGGCLWTVIWILSRLPWLEVVAPAAEVPDDDEGAVEGLGWDCSTLVAASLLPDLSLTSALLPPQAVLFRSWVLALPCPVWLALVVPSLPWFIASETPFA